ncbi:MAG: Cys-tRNA(Pro) deacylase [Clostridia bacterium]|nr:Cys-tRNA(Pro) deacylase [Clostridia bacterium]
MAQKQEKTNVMRLLDGAKIPYVSHCYLTSGAVSATDLAAALGEDPAHVFKTLVTVGKSGAHYVFMVPAAEELNLKKAASAVGEKAIEMIKSKELLPLTGYIHGGCSPIGMKKFFQTTIHETAAQFDTILFSAGKIGYQVELPLESLKKIVAVGVADIIV